MSKPSNGSRRPDTRIVTAGRDPFSHYGAVNPPVYHASTILHRTVDALENGTQAYTYGRNLTPTIESLQTAIRDLEGGEHTVLCPSGLQACTLAILSAVSAGDHLLVTDSIYGPTRRFCDRTLTRFGVTTTYFDPNAGAGVEKLFRPNTKAIFVESPGSLTFEIQDIPAIAECAHANDIAVILDNTWATPLLFDAIGHGVDLSVMAATKYVVGHSDALMGTVTASARYAKQLKDTHHNLGISVGPDDVYLAQRGLRTMHVRMRAHEAAALRVARWLEARPEVARVMHPALESDPGHEIWKRDFRGSSGLFGVELKACPEKAVAAMLEGYDLFGMGWSWGGYESLVITAHPLRTAVPLRAQGPLLRYHIGLEDTDDLIADLEAGFARLNQAR
ncbi:MAG: cystathionine beta-lyase [Alphaproteobacteria bacterium]|jgi:cystathionine beta-lyase